MKKIISIAAAMILCIIPLTHTVAYADPVVEPSSQHFKVNGVNVTAEIYNIDGNNYFKLRDIAMLLKDTSAHFSVDFDEDSGTISAKNAGIYEPVGGELEIGADRSSSCVPSTQSLLVDLMPVQITAYNLGGNNFFKLRDLGDAFGFYVGYDSDTNTAIIDSDYYIRHTDLDPRGYNLIMSYEIPVFNSGIESIRKVNDYMKSLEDSFVNGEWDDVKDTVESNPPGDEFAYEDIWKSEVYTYSPNIISIVQEYYWFMGGSSNDGYRGYNFDTNTGEIIYLDDVVAGTEEEIKDAIVEGLKYNAYFEASEGTKNYDNAVAAVREMNIKDINFCMDEDGHVYALFSKSEITTGSAGSFMVELKDVEIKNDYDWR